MEVGEREAGIGREREGEAGIGKEARERGSWKLGRRGGKGR